MKQFSAVVTGNQQIADGYYEMEVAWDKRAGIPQPGQFATLRVSAQTQPLLRRPLAFSGFDFKRERATFIYQKRGSATQILAGKAVSEQVDCIGPLGRGFEPKPHSRQHICIAGGIGIGPIVYLAHTLKQQGAQVLLILGAQTAPRLPKFSQWDELKPAVCTDDGSEGFKGTVVDFCAALPAAQIAGAEVYCCGPHPMLRACHDFSAHRGLDCFVSMEQVMACGVGACMGCVIEIKGDKKFARVCTEGPVFNSKDIVWK
jgi:dihydroorotate dehydrogenase electron transfer subunit